MVPYHEMKGDDYVDPHLLQLVNEFRFQKNKGKKSFSYESKVSIAFITIRRMCFWCTIMQRKEIIICIHVYHN